MEALTPPTKEVLVRIINRFFNRCSTYIIQSLFKPIDQANSKRFIIVVFSETAPSDSARMASDAIAQETNHTVSATFLLHRTRDLRTQNNCLQTFFYHVLRDGQRLCLDTAHVPYLPFGGIPMRDRDEVSAFWYKCEAVASLYLEAAASERLEVELVKISLLHTAVEQICLGLIRLLSGYVPNTHSLRFMMELCEYFTSVPGECFPQQGEANLNRYKRLCAPPSMLRYWTRLDAPEADFILLHENTQEFLKQAMRLAESELEKMNTNQQHF